MGYDVSPLQMVRHQMKGLSRYGRARFEEVNVYLNQGKAIPQGVENELQDISANVQLLDKQRFSNRSFVQRFFKYYPEGMTLEHAFRKPAKYFDLFLAVTTFLNDCRSTYCVWMDPDIFVHKASDGQGWVDHAVATMNSYSRVSIMTGANPNLARGNDNTEASCKIHVGRGVSERHMVIHKERFLKEFPVQLKCAPRCDSWERVLSNQVLESTVLHTDCGGHGFWVMHPPGTKADILEIIRSCDPDKHDIEKGVGTLLERFENIDAEEVQAADSVNGVEDVADEGGWTCVKNISKFFRLAFTLARKEILVR